MGLDWWDKCTYGPGFYFWRTPDMNPKHVIVIQISVYKNPDIAPGRLHVEMLVPASGGLPKYSYHGPIEKMPGGLFYGPLKVPDPGRRYEL